MLVAYRPVGLSALEAHYAGGLGPLGGLPFAAEAMRRRRRLPASPAPPSPHSLGGASGPWRRFRRQEAENIAQLGVWDRASVGIGTGSPGTFLQAALFGRREAARVAHEELDPPTSSRRPTPESDRPCSSR
jgi:hypothetical protein